MPDSAQERTEAASPKRKQDARKKGQIARSAELPQASGLLVGVLALRLTAPIAWQGLSGLMQNDLTALSRPDVSARDAVSIIGGSVIAGALAIAPILLAFGAGGIAAGLVQTGGLVSMKALAPKFDRLNPMQGVKRVFGANTAFELVKMIVRLAVIGGVIWSMQSQVTAQLMTMAQSGVSGAPAGLGEIVFTVLLRIAIAGMVLAALDYAFQRWRFSRELRMTKQEVKEEHKQLDGDPQIKQRVRRMQRQRAKQRMMQEVPKATVVVTNPTHFAVALRYESGRTRAPVVVAKGQDLIAQQIKAIARQHGVPVVENPPLARALHAAVKLNHEIPAQLYRAVAEVLAFVYKLRRRW